MVTARSLAFHLTARHRCSSVATWMILLPLCAVATSATAGANTSDPPDTTSSSRPGAIEHLGALIDEALGHHPLLSSTRRSAAAAAAVVPQAGSLPDPVIGFEASNLRIDEPRLSASPMSGYAITLQQGIPFFGKLGRRKEVARQGARVAGEVVLETEAEVTARVKRSYWMLYFTQRAEDITRENLEILDTLLNAAIARFSVGLAPQQDVLKAEVALSRLREQLLIREQKRRTAEAELNTSVGRLPDAPLGRASPPDLGTEQFDRATTRQNVIEKNPRLRVAEAATDEAEAAVREAGYDYWPDLSLKLGYRIRDVVPGDPTEGADMFVASIAATLPLYARSKQSEREEETRQRLMAAEQATRNSELEVLFEAERLLDEIERQESQEEVFRNEILPQSRQALDVSMSEYSVGGVEFLSVLDNWQKLLDHRLACEKVVTDRASRVADLEALLGRTSP